MFVGDLTTEQGKQDYDNYIMNNVRNEINSYTKQTQNNSGSALSSQLGLATPTTTIPVGTISPYAGSGAPAGWLLCNGAAVSRNTYSALFAVTSTSYGAGDGSTTFNVPDLRGRTIVGAGTGAQQGVSGSGIITGGTALNARSVGQFFGDERLQSHTHTFSGTTSGHSADHSHGFNPRSAGGWNSGATQVIINGGSQYWGLRSTANNGDGGTTGPTYGVSNDHTHTYSGTVSEHNQTPVGVQQNLQPSVVTGYIIKAIPDVSNTFAIALGGDAGGGLTGTYPNPTVASIAGLTAGGGLTGTYPNPTIAAPVMFSSYGLASYSIGSGGEFVFNTVVTNIGSAYNSTTGRFTAPVDGYYMFHYSFLSAASAGVVDTRLRINQSTLLAAAYSGDSVSSYKSGGASAGTLLTAGQYVSVISNGTSSCHADPGHQVFSGSLIK